MIGRTLQPGDDALTDYNQVKGIVRVKIVERREHRGTRSGIQFKVSPRLSTKPSVWYDADWFWPVKK